MRIRFLKEDNCYEIRDTDTDRFLTKTESLMEAIDYSKRLLRDKEKRVREHGIRSNFSFLHETSKLTPPPLPKRGERVSPANEIWGSECQAEIDHLEFKICGHDSQPI